MNNKQSIIFVILPIENLTGCEVGQNKKAAYSAAFTNFYNRPRLDYSSARAFKSASTSDS